MKYAGKTTLGLIALLAAATTVAEESCIVPDDVVGARYRISETVSEDPTQRTSYEFRILRPSASRLIYDMPATHLTQVYERYGNGRIKLLEYFHLEHIGVEHEPADPLNGRDWAVMAELIAKSKVESLPLEGRGRYHCLATQLRRGSDGGATIAVEYLEDVQLPVTLTRSSNGVEKRWELEALVTDASLATDLQTKLDGYALYDFADLGDSENEEFFRSSRYLNYKLGHAHQHEH